MGGQHGGQPSNSSGGSGGIGGIAGQLVGSFLDGGGKPQKQQQQQQQQPPSQQSGGGFMNLFGGHHGSSVSRERCRCRSRLIYLAESEQQLRVLLWRAKLKQRWLFSTSSPRIIPGAGPAWICGCTIPGAATSATCRPEQQCWLLLPSSTILIPSLRSTRIYWGTAYAYSAGDAWTLE